MTGPGIWVFSGTGNTLKCAQALEDALRALGREPRLHLIEDGTESASEEELVLCYPVHGFNAPNAVLRFCRNLAPRAGRVWFMKTSGEPLRLNDASSAELIKILRRKGYAVYGEFHYVMPYNMVFRHSDETASLMWKTALERIPEAAKKIVRSERQTIGAPLSARIVSGLCRVEHRFYPLNGRLFRVRRDRCLRCMRCVSECPTGNIRCDGGRFRFGVRCIGCFRCSFRCPADAIRIGLLDFMRVNGPYDFTRDPQKAVFGRYCKKAYRRYFGGKNGKG